MAGLAQIMPVRSPAWRALATLPDPAARYAAFRDDPTRAALLAEGIAAGTCDDPAHIHPLGQDEHPDYGVDADSRSVAELAAEAGVHPVEFIVDRLLASEGRELFNVWFFTRNRESLATYLTLDAVVPGLGDAGAHVGQICDADATTFVLGYWARDRGVLSVPEAVRKLSSQSAQILGLRERGEIRPGWYADLNVFDVERLASHYPTYVNDFPGGKGRFIVRSDGYAATIVNGQIVVEDGDHTGARPGTVLATSPAERRVAPAARTGNQGGILSGVPVTREDIDAAADRIGTRARRTPVIDHDGLVLKLECLQHAGSFKTRGAFNRVLSEPTLSHAGVIAASGGNHGAAVAHVGAALGITTEIFLPSTSPTIKRRTIERFGATVHVIEGLYDDAQTAADLRRAETGATMIHPYDHPATVAGQGTMGRRAGGSDGWVRHPDRGCGWWRLHRRSGRLVP